MQHKTLFLCLALGLMTGLTLGCEEKQPAAPASTEVTNVEDQMTEEAQDAQQAAGEAVQDAAEAVEEAADKTGDAAEAVKDAMPKE